MSKITLGVHLGHNASCAVVIDGFLKSAIQQERKTRIKQDGRPIFSNNLPIIECLDAAGVKLSEVDNIVSSIQSIAPGGVGLHLPLIDGDFSLFNIEDQRHSFISHHLAHATSSYGCSGFKDASILVLDLAGSSTVNGRDYHLSFPEFKKYLSNKIDDSKVKTENLSIYSFDSAGPKLLDRKFAIPHPAPEIYVQSAATLYDNVSRFIFGSENAHGQMMALASLPTQEKIIDLNELIRISNGSKVSYCNDWKTNFRVNSDPLVNIPIAKAVQNALQKACMAYVKYTKNISFSNNLTVAGGIFLNILVNSEIYNSGIFETCYFPSTPHDAGIAVGCAFYGQKIWEKPNISYRNNPVNDRLGIVPDISKCENAIEQHSPFLVNKGKVTAEEIAGMLESGAIIARCSGRSEFGPRALGARSLLASSLRAESKTLLNKIKRRQAWRPVAPIITEESLKHFFIGPKISPYMNFVHLIPEYHRSALLALEHPDGSTRVQTLRRYEDSFLYDVIKLFGQKTGYPILVNTSLNGKGQPIIETYDQAIVFFRCHSEVDALLLDHQLVVRSDNIWGHKYFDDADVSFKDGTLMTIMMVNNKRKCILINGKNSLDIPDELIDVLYLLNGSPNVKYIISEFRRKNGDGLHVLQSAFDRGLLEVKKHDQ